MRILVTGGCGFIGSHTSDRLISEGHDVVVVDALRPPVHRDGKPLHIPEGAEFIKGDVRDKSLMTDVLSRVDAVFHFAAYQDYLTDFSTFFDVNVTATALLYEIILANQISLKRVVVASSQAVMGEGLYLCPRDGDVLPPIRQDDQLREGRWDIDCPTCGGPIDYRPSPERIANPRNPYAMSKYAQESVALNLGQQHGIPTVALRYSIVQGPRQSVYNAYSGACRIFSLAYKLGRSPVVYEDGASIRDFVNIADVVDANMLALRSGDAVGQVFNVGGGMPYTVREFLEIVRKAFGSSLQASMLQTYRHGDTRHIFSDISSLRSLGWEPSRTPEVSVSAYAAWLEEMPGLERILDEADQKMRDSGVVRAVVQ